MRVCEKNSHVFFVSFFAVRFVAKENMPAENMLVQLLALYTNPKSHNAQHHRLTDGWTDRYDKIGLCQ